MPAPSLCVISGVVYDENGVPAPNVTLYLTKVLLNGVLIGTAPIGTANIPGPSGDHPVQYIEAITSIAGGVISFTVPQLSTIYLEGNVSGYNNGEVALSIPATATSTLEALTPATFPIDVTTFTFLSLVDTPDDYTGHGLKNVRVNAAGTALEFAAASAVVTAEEIQDALVSFFPDVAPFDWTYDDAGDRVTLAILDATASARGLMSTAYATRLDQLEVGDAPTFAGLTLTGILNTTAAIRDTTFTNNVLNLGTNLGGPLQLKSSSNLLIDVQNDVNEILLRTGSSLTTKLAVSNAGLIGINKSTGLTAQLHTLSNAIGVIPLIAEGPAGQTANLFEARVNGALMMGLAANGNLTVNGTQLAIGAAGAGRSYFNTSSGWNLGSAMKVGWTSATDGGASALDVALARSAAALIAPTNGSTGGGGFEFTEVADFAAGATNKARLYARDNGSGKTQLVVIFATGAVQVLATEP